MQQKAVFKKMINKINKPQARFTKKKNRKNSNKIRNKTGEL